MKCKKCGDEFEPKKGLLSFCSMSCRNSRQFSEETRELKSESGKAHYASLSEVDKQNLREKMGKLRNCRVTSYDYLFGREFEDLAWDSKRLRIMVEQDFKCRNCGLSEWLGQPLTLEVDHTDGDRSNNQRDNLVGLCPNCHSLTPTWRGRHPVKRSYRQQRVAVLQTCSSAVRGS